MTQNSGKKKSSRLIVTPDLKLVPPEAHDLKAITGASFESRIHSQELLFGATYWDEVCYVQPAHLFTQSIGYDPRFKPLDEAGVLTRYDEGIEGQADKIGVNGNRVSLGPSATEMYVEALVRGVTRVAQSARYNFTISPRSQVKVTPSGKLEADSLLFQIHNVVPIVEDFNDAEDFLNWRHKNRGTLRRIRNSSQLVERSIKNEGDLNTAAKEIAECIEQAAWKANERGIRLSLGDFHVEVATKELSLVDFAKEAGAIAAIPLTFLPPSIGIGAGVLGALYDTSRKGQLRFTLQGKTNIPNNTYGFPYAQYSKNMIEARRSFSNR